MDLQKYLTFWTVWYGFTMSLLALQFTIYQIAIADSSKTIAQEFAESSSRDSLLSRAVVASSLLSNAVFGEHIISKRAFFRGFLISVVVFVLAYTIAVATTPEISDNFSLSPVGLLTWIRLADFTMPFSSIFPWVLAWSLSLVLAIIWLVGEFLFVAKSRWIIRRVSINTPFYLLICFFVTDVISSILMMSVFAPIFLIIFGEAFLYAVGDAVNTNFVEIIAGSYATLMPRPENLWTVYKLLSISIGRDIWSHFQGDFRSYYTAAIGAFVDKGCQLNGYSIVSCHSLYLFEGHFLGMSINVVFFVTTMFVSALATTIWMAICVVTLVLFKICRIPGSVFSWIHEHPRQILKYIILPTSIVSLAGGFVIPLLYFG